MLHVWARVAAWGLAGLRARCFPGLLASCLWPRVLFHVCVCVAVSALAVVGCFWSRPVLRHTCALGCVSAACLRALTSHRGIYKKLHAHTAGQKSPRTCAQGCVNAACVRESASPGRIATKNTCTNNWVASGRGPCPGTCALGCASVTCARALANHCGICLTTCMHKRQFRKACVR